MFCSKCGKENPEGASFCSSCGTNINGGSTTSKNQSSPPPVNRVTPPSANFLPQQNNQNTVSGIGWFFHVLKNYVNFEGRATRSEYWYYALFQFLTILLLSILAAAIDQSLMILLGLFVLGTLLPSLAVSVRRLHDIDFSGWFLLFYLIPFFGNLIIFVFTVIDSTPRDNQFGPYPK